MDYINWQCPKCECTKYEKDQLTATGGGFTKFFNVQSKKFMTITCTKCRYTEMYKEETSTIGNVLDFFGN